MIPNICILFEVGEGGSVRLSTLCSVTGKTGCSVLVLVGRGASELTSSPSLHSCTSLSLIAVSFYQ